MSMPSGNYTARQANHIGALKRAADARFAARQKAQRQYEAIICREADSVSAGATYPALRRFMRITGAMGEQLIIAAEDY